MASAVDALIGQRSLAIEVGSSIGNLTQQQASYACHEINRI
jgi:hypothetical protein